MLADKRPVPSAKVSRVYLRLGVIVQSLPVARKDPGLGEDYGPDMWWHDNYNTERLI